MKRNDLPECFGTQGLVMLDGDMPTECLECGVFEKCHKITLGACLHSISNDLDLIVQNGLVYGRLKGFAELEKEADS